MKMDRVIAVRNHKTVFRDGNRCIKMFDETYTKADVLSEALSHARVEETGLNVPEILELVKLDGKWAIVSRFVQGRTLARLLREQPDRTDEFMNLFVNLQLQVHSKTCPLLTRQKEKLDMQILKCDLDATTRYDLHSRLDSMNRQYYLCHGDFAPDNIILQPDGTPCIVDWAHATQGSPAADAAQTHLQFLLDGQEDLAQKYLSLYCETCAIAPAALEKWLPIMAAARSVKGHAGEKALLLSLARSAALKLV